MGLGRSVFLRADLLKILSEQITSFPFQNTRIVTKLGLCDYRAPEAGAHAVTPGR